MNDAQRNLIQGREDALEMLDLPGWTNVCMAVSAEIGQLHSHLERGLEREEYLLTVGEIRGLRKVLEMPRTAVAAGDTVIEEMDA